jgi:hypothetical protein
MKSRLHRNRELVGTSIVCMGILLFCGCGSSAHIASVSGHVTLDGKAIEQGSILLAAVEGDKRFVTNAEIRNGEYRIEKARGPAVGVNRVEIHAAKKTGRLVSVGLGGDASEMVEAIPAKFNSASTLTVDIKAGDNTANFDVTSKQL